MESTRDFYVPGDEEDMDIFEVLSYSTTEEGGAHEMVRRDAQLTLVANDRLLKMCDKNSVVQFRGTKYVLGGAEYPHLLSRRDSTNPMIEVNLIDRSRLI